MAKLEVFIRFRIKDAAEAMKGVLKQSTMRLNDTTFCSHLYAHDINAIQFCLTRKNEIIDWLTEDVHESSSFFLGLALPNNMKMMSMVDNFKKRS
jgi:hypothetical protein